MYDWELFVGKVEKRRFGEKGEKARWLMGDLTKLSKAIRRFRSLLTT
jgi:hypothetical protein